MPMTTLGARKLAPFVVGPHPAHGAIYIDGRHVRTYFTGGAPNASLAAQILAPEFGVPGSVRLATLVGDQNEPDTSEHSDAGVILHTLVVPGSLRTNETHICPGADIEPRHGTSRLTITRGHLRRFRRICRSVQRGQVAVFTGSLPEKVPPRLLARMILTVILVKNSPHVIIDTRPEILREVIGFLKAVLRYSPPWLRAMVFSRIIVKQNRKEFTALASPAHLNGHASWVTQARRLLPGGTFVITMRECTLVVTPIEAKCVTLDPAFLPDVVSTEGCGDTKVGAIAVALSAGFGIFEAVRLGTGAAQANTENDRPGRLDPQRARFLAGHTIVEPVLN